MAGFFHDIGDGVFGAVSKKAPSLRVFTDMSVDMWSLIGLPQEVWRGLGGSTVGSHRARPMPTNRAASK